MADSLPGEFSQFGVELRRLREEAHLSQSDLAKKINYSKGYLSKIETGRARPNPDFARRCDEILDTNRLSELAVSSGSRENRLAPATAPSLDLPREPVNFVGRDVEMQQLSALLSCDRDAGHGAPVVGVVVGMGGVGKTALALRVAHQLAETFPDGSLYLDLHGYADSLPVTPAEALERLLRRLGVPGHAIPVHVDDRAALFRVRVAGRRILLFLDNANSAAQVTPLLPATFGCRVLITSRSMLNALEDATRINAGPLPLQEAIRLVELYSAGSKTTDRHPSDRDWQARIAEWCGGLPLAISIAAASFRAASAEVAGLGDWAHDETSILNGLDDGERSIASVFDHSFRLLRTDLARTFMLVGLHGGTEFCLGAAAALAGIRGEEIRIHLRRLLDANLLTEESPGRFRLHDLLGLFARDRAVALLPEATRDEAVRREVDYYLWSLDLADRIITPLRYRAALDMDPEATNAGTSDQVTPYHPRDYHDAVGWVAREQDNILGVCRRAFAAGLNGRCWQLAYAFRGFLFLAKPQDIWIETHKIALRAAQRAGRPHAEAQTRNNLGLALMEGGDYRAAAEHYQTAWLLFRELGDAHGENTALAHHAWVHYHQGNLDQALADSCSALEFVEREGSPRNRAILLRDIALIEIRLGRYDAAISRLKESLQMFEDLGLHVDAAMALNYLGEALRGQGRSSEAKGILHSAAQRGAWCGSLFEEARAYEELGGLAAEEGDGDLALSHWERAMDGYQRLCDTRHADVVRSRIESLPAQHRGGRRPSGDAIVAERKNAERATIETGCTDCIGNPRVEDRDDLDDEVDR
ncbi:helix-turn-helix domain-containing protein [Frankia sp. Cr1]|uniref:helix-turn-helix domain-containing protein n=1 Tax=Frankia sp. Cr1 TaxID=3073931 RepID=UPI002AD22A47|nr:tetratricopeptide repeat protein [Frankia sp. Cr1]